MTVKDDPIYINYPDKVYITSVASSEGEDSAFNLEAKFILDFGNYEIENIIEVIDTEIIEEEVIQVDSESRPSNSNKEDKNTTENVTLILLIIILSLAVIAIIIYLSLRLKRKGNCCSKKRNNIIKDPKLSKTPTNESLHR